MLSLGLLSGLPLTHNPPPSHVLLSIIFFSALLLGFVCEGRVGGRLEGEPPGHRQGRREESADDHETGGRRRVGHADARRVLGRGQEIPEPGE